MDILGLEAAIVLCREAKITSFVWGYHGLGKSYAHHHVAKVNRWGFIDARCSQLEATDLRGLPKDQNGLTVYLPPADLPQGHEPEAKCPACDEHKDYDNYPPHKFCKGLLFLDEINRAEDDVLQAVFQLVWDRKIGFYQVPDGWSLHCAGNYNKGYTTNNFQDAAFLDRFCHLEVNTGEQYATSWIDWMSRNYPGSDKIIQFVGFNKDNLIGNVEGDRGFTIEPSPRSWAMVAQVEEACINNEFPSNTRMDVLSGLVGLHLAQSYDQFSCEVTPQQIMRDGPELYLSKLNAFSRNTIIGLVHGVASNARQTDPKKRQKKMMENVCEFMRWVANNSQRDLAVALGRALIADESSDLNGAFLSNPKLAKLARGYQKKHKKIDYVTWIEMLTSYKDLDEIMSQVCTGTMSKKI